MSCGEIKDWIDMEIDNLIPFDNYPLKQFEGRRLEEMITEIDGTDPIIVRPADNGKYEILNGHYRFIAAKRLKWATVPVRIYTGLSDEEALEFLSDTNPVGLLKKHRIDIYSDDYRKSDGYEKLKNSRIFVDDDFSMALDEYIERFLLTDYMRYDLYESIYCMGNPHEFSEEECTDEAVARDIIRINDPEREQGIEEFGEEKDYSDIRALKIAEESIDAEVKEFIKLF